MVFFWILTVVIALHIALFFIGINLETPPREQPPQSVIKVSFITKSATIKAKQNDTVITENKPSIVDVAPQPQHPKPVKARPKPIEKIVTKSVVIVKKEAPNPKILTTEKSEIVVKKVEKLAKTPKSEIEKVEIKEKPRLSLELIKQQISQVGSNISLQQINVRDKYIYDFGTKVKRIGQTIYDRGTLPAGILETKIEINADGSLVNLKITRSSGSTKLDDAVENMIRSSAPYPDLPFQLLNESNTLSFTRIWEFYGD